MKDLAKHLTNRLIEMIVIGMVVSGYIMLALFIMS